MNGVSNSESDFALIMYGTYVNDIISSSCSPAQFCVEFFHVSRHRFTRFWHLHLASKIERNKFILNYYV